MSGLSHVNDTDEPIRTDALIDAFKPGFSPAIGLKALNRWSEMNKELARFYSQRVKTDLKMLSECASCREPAEIGAVWMKAANTAIRDYTDEFDRLMAINIPAEH